MSKNDSLSEWERVFAAAAYLQQLLPDAVLVGGTAAAVYAAQRLSVGADHVLTDLKSRFDQVLGELESVAGWETARVNRPVLILGSLDGIETGTRQLIRRKPLETQQIEHAGLKITLPTSAEMLRIKASSILKRNATRDYLNFAALAERLGTPATARALERLDELYRQPRGESALQQLQVQLANPLPYDLEQANPSEYKRVDAKWHDLAVVRRTCGRCATGAFDLVEQWKIERESNLELGG